VVAEAVVVVAAVVMAEGAAADMAAAVVATGVNLPISFYARRGHLRRAPTRPT